MRHVSLSAGRLTRTALTPHVLDFLGLPNASVGRKHPRCGV
ncbi:hypothetical protein [Roseateles aquatilis]|nr:hypothetical protein [Roseateles aquatilis]